MKELLEFYVSGFGTWAGLTIGLAIVCGGVRNTVAFGLNVWRS
ncbi:hypothetical protein [Mesorhizobium sp. B2-1-2]|nr:hypothetical protein [Mesorhizobium sp. B2-1-2]